MEGPSATYVIPLAVRLFGELEVSALEGALNDVVGRHEPARCFLRRLGFRGRRYCLRVRRGLGSSWLRVSEEELGAALSAAARRGFDLGGELPLRAHVFALSAREHVVLVVLHHIAGDGWSLRVLVRDLAGFYAARLQGRPAGLVPLAVQYADYTLWQREAVGGRGRWREPAGAPAWVLAGSAGGITGTD